jgi:hypothetical protein
MHNFRISSFFDVVLSFDGRVEAENFLEKEHWY